MYIIVENAALWQLNMRESAQFQLLRVPLDFTIHYCSYYLLHPIYSTLQSFMFCKASSLFQFFQSLSMIDPLYLYVTVFTRA